MFKGKVRGRVERRWGMGDVPNGAYILEGAPPLYVGRNLIGEQDDARPFTLGPHRLYPIDKDHLRYAVIAVPINGPLWWLPVLRYWCESVGQRLLATAHVWGLADWPMGEAQTWRSVYLLRWLAERLGRA